MRVHSWHFDLGNSDEGPIGYCARVWAETPEKAVGFLQASLPHEWEVMRGGIAIEYLAVYPNADAISTDNIDFWSPAGTVGYDIPFDLERWQKDYQAFLMQDEEEE